MYSRLIEGEEYSFGVSGKLIRNVLLMYDRQTNTFWSQLIGEAVQGELKGTKLEYLPSWFMTWEEWRTTYPETLALEKGPRGSRDPYTDYYNSGRAGVIPETLADDRLYTKEFVIGLELANSSKAYPYSILNESPVVNDQVDDTAILVVFDEASTGHAVFDREIDGQTLTFSLLNDDIDQISDAETGSTWNSLTGIATEGPLAGAMLNRLKSTNVFWFGWKDFHPETLIYGQETS